MSLRSRSLLATLLLSTGLLAAPAFAATEAMTWTSLVSAATGSGGAISKLAGPSWYASGTGTRSLSADGRFEFRVSHTGFNPWVNAMTVCLNSGTASVTDGASLEHCLVIGAGYASVYERGRWTTDIAISTSDLLGIGTVGGSVRYYRNGTAFHSSALAPALPVVPFFATGYDGYGLTSATLTTDQAAPPPPPPPPPPSSTTGAVSWTARVATAVNTTGGITKTAGGSWYGAAVSEQTLGADGRYEFQVNNTGLSPFVNAMQVCLDSGTYDIYTPASLDHCLIVGAGVASAYVAGRWSSDTPVTTADRLALGVEGGVVRFYRNGVAFYTSGTRPVFPARAVFLTSYDGYGLTSAAVAGGTGTTTPPPSNRAPVLSGTGTRTIRVGEAYSFTPTASDPDGNRLTFAVSGRPAWLAFDAATGRLYGTPASTNVGTFPMTITASDGSLSASLALTVTVTAANRAPTISGPASASVLVGQPYSFTPTASDPDGDRLTFTASGLPAWAAFDAATGRVSGTPSASQVGSSTPRITVSDGALSASLGYSLAVVAVSSGRATLSWTPPLTRTDGSTLTNLAGYRVYFGTSSTSLTNRVAIDNPSVSTWLVENLTAGTWHFAVTAVDAAGLESSRAGPVSLTVN
jgi:hypothetical protein